MSLLGQKAKYSLRADVFRFAPDIVAKVPKGAAANFLPKNETSEHRRSTGLQTRYQNRR
jgi:hypothetical protein